MTTVLAILRKSFFNKALWRDLAGWFLFLVFVVVMFTDKFSAGAIATVFLLAKPKKREHLITPFTTVR